MKANTKAVAVTLLLAAGVVATAARANLIANGSFEAPSVRVGSFENFLGGSTAIPGWTVLGTEAAVVSGSIVVGSIVGQAQEGVQWMDLAGLLSNSSANGVLQSVPTIAGVPYRLTFYVGSSNNDVTIFPSTVDLSVGGSARISYFNPNAPTNMIDWQQFTFEFTAIQTATTIAFYNGSASNNITTALDNVSLIPVPEPMTFAMLLAGLTALAVNGAAFGRRRAHYAL